MKNKFIIILSALCSILKSQISIVDTSIVFSFDTLNGTYFIKPNLNIQPTQFLGTNLRVNSNNSLNLTKSINDESGIHYTYRQYFNNIYVEHSMMRLHCDVNNFVRNLSTNFLDITGINTVPNISPEQSIDFAKNHYTDVIFAWEDPILEEQIKDMLEDSLASNKPKPELLLTNVNGSLKLAYKLFVYTSIPYGKEYLYIDAQNGNLIFRQNAIKSCFNWKSKNSNDDQNSKAPNPNFDVSACGANCVTGTGNTLYYGSQYIQTNQYKKGLDCKYRLKDNCSNTEIYTVQYDHGLTNNTEKVEDVTDQTNNWVFTQTSPGVTAHWCAEKAYNYFKSTFGRNSWDDADSDIKTFVNKKQQNKTNGKWTENYDNAEWDPSVHVLIIGNGGGGKTYNDLTSLDVIGHELTHGITETEVNFAYSGETGALDEGFADIFGTLIEFNSISNPNWYIGESFWVADGKARDMSNPNNKTEILFARDCNQNISAKQPDTYLGNHWLSGGCDGGGVHINSGVLNYWFYLLSQGGSGTNDLGNPYCVNGITTYPASRIAYKALTQYMLPTDNFLNARNRTLQAAFDLYGLSSPEANEVASAWYAVGVGSSAASLLSGYIQLFNKAENSSVNYHYNKTVRLETYTVQPSVTVNVSSSKQINITPEHYVFFNPSTYGDTHIKQGSEFHAYIATACLGGARFGNTSEGRGGAESSNETTIVQIQKEQSVVSKFNPFLVMPNPTTGAFKIQLDNSLEYPKQIVIRDVLGKIVTSVENPDSYDFEFSLSGEKDGVYMVIVYYSDNVFSKRIIKN